MKILTGKMAGNYEEAVTLALQTAGLSGMSDGIGNMFTSLANDHRISSEADRLTGSAIRSRYGSKATWRTERWLVPVARLRYEVKGLPQLVIEITVYVVATALVRTAQDSRLITLVGAVGKPETLDIPIVFLHAVSSNDLGKFSIIARDAVYTIWEVPGAKPVRLPNEFVNELGEILRYQSVVDWLREFGSQGRYVAPLVAGSLLGLAFQDPSHPVPINKQGFTTAELVSTLENMAFRHSEAEEMVQRAAPRLQADMTLEEAIRITLQTGKGED